MALTQSQSRLPAPQRMPAVHAEVLADGLYRTEKVAPLEAYLMEQVRALLWMGDGCYIGWRGVSRGSVGVEVREHSVCYSGWWVVGRGSGAV